MKRNAYDILGSTTHSSRSRRRKIVTKKLRWFGHVVRAKGTLENTCRGKIRRKASKTVAGRCKEMDRAELK